MGHYQVIGIVFGTPRNVTEARNWLKRNKFNYIRLHIVNGYYVLYYARKDKKYVKLDKFMSLESVVRYVNRYGAAIYKMACDTNETCFDGDYKKRLKHLYANVDRGIESMDIDMGHKDTVIKEGPKEELEHKEEKKQKVEKDYGYEWPPGFEGKEVVLTI